MHFNARKEGGCLAAESLAVAKKKDIKCGLSRLREKKNILTAMTHNHTFLTIDKCYPYMHTLFLHVGNQKFQFGDFYRMIFILFRENSSNWG